MASLSTLRALDPASTPPAYVHHVDYQPIEEGDGALEEIDPNTTKIESSVRACLNYSPKKAHRLTRRILRVQAELKAGGAVSAVLSKENSKPQLILTGQRIHILKQRVGVGSYSEVYSADVIATVRHEVGGEVFSPSKPVQKAIKKGKRAGTTFSPEKRKLDNATGPNSKGIDAFATTFKDTKGYGYSLNRLYSCDLSHANFHLMEQPVSALLKTLISASMGLAAIHSSGSVHRDIKGGNILVAIPSGDSTSGEDGSAAASSVSDEAEGAVTDFGFLQKAKKEVHHTTGTPEYLDPTMFGDLEMCILNQKVREGCQTKEGDVFALGITIYRDVLMRFIDGISQGTSERKEIQALLESLKPTVKKGHFSDDELKQEGNTSDFRVVHTFDSQRRDVLIRYPDLNYLDQTLTGACLKLQGKLSEQEMNVLVQLSHLSCRMQYFKLDERPTIHQAIEEMGVMLESLQSSEVSSVGPSDDEDELASDEVSHSAKKAKTQADATTLSLLPTQRIPPSLE